MQIEKLKIDGLVVLTPRKFEDDRGYFFESFNQQLFNQAIGEEIIFVQDNESKSKKGVVRGLHFQAPPFGQGKLVRVTTGSVLDIAVDIRKNSPTYGQYAKLFLSADNGKQFWIPEGFAHGFVALEDDTKFIYKCTNYYAPQSEGCIVWNDPLIKIDWEMVEPLVSEKDTMGENFINFDSPF